MDSCLCVLSQILALLPECRNRNRQSFDGSTFFRSSAFPSLKMEQWSTRWFLYLNQLNVSSYFISTSKQCSSGTKRLLVGMSLKSHKSWWGPWFLVIVYVAVKVPAVSTYLCLGFGKEKLEIRKLFCRLTNIFIPHIPKKKKIQLHFCVLLESTM